MLADILGEDPISTALTAPATRHPIMRWAYVAAAHEKDMPRDAHRGHNTARADYLRHLIDLGYVPADVERRVISAVYPDTKTRHRCRAGRHRTHRRCRAGRQRAHRRCWAGRQGTHR